ncbi:MAG: LacI family transcriptional regulator [Fimbriimonadales bacterium]|nr:LacI family transcriptional regulator [Fimbriimonadales bacterium]
MRIRFNPEMPRYVQVRQWVERQIALGYWRSGDVLPPERELANQLGVSPLTISRALQALAREGVLMRKRRVGTVVASELPPTLLQRTFTLMVLGIRAGTRQTTDFYYGAVQRSILSKLSDHAIRTLWLDYQFDQVERELQSGEVIGILAIAPAAEHIPLLNGLFERGVPILVVGASAEEWVLPSVDTDNYRAARQGVQHLLELGHRRFVGLFGALETFNSRDRWRGFRDALREAGVPSESVWTFTVPYADEIGDAFREGLATVLRLPNRPTAVFAGGFYLALSALQTIHQLGLRVPQDVSVLGFDDPPSASLAMPPLTTFRQPLEQLGALAVQRLLELAKGHKPTPLHEYLPLELIVRESTGRAP